MHDKTEIINNILAPKFELAFPPFILPFQKLILKKIFKVELTLLIFLIKKIY